MILKINCTHGKICVITRLKIKRGERTNRINFMIVYSWTCNRYSTKLIFIVHPSKCIWNSIW